jgi:chromate reductase, NAD(P)H dehydrogenase (quinone)
MTDGPVSVLALCGSLRRASYNMAVLRAAQELAPEGLRIEISDLAAIPLFNEDVRLAGFPQVVVALREAIRGADALLFACPEHNYSVPGVLKNAIDWVSRPPDQPFAGKPAAVLGASTGVTGTARAQHHLRQIGVAVDLRFLNRPEVRIGSAAERFDAQGHLTNETSRQLIGKQLAALRDWTLQLRK